MLTRGVDSLEQDGQLLSR